MGGKYDDYWVYKLGKYKYKTVFNTQIKNLWRIFYISPKIVRRSRPFEWYKNLCGKIEKWNHYDQSKYGYEITKKRLIVRVNF